MCPKQIALPIFQISPYETQLHDPVKKTAHCKKIGVNSINRSKSPSQTKKNAEKIKKFFFLELIK
jgi:hypothetical protein